MSKVDEIVRLRNPLLFWFLPFTRRLSNGIPLSDMPHTGLNFCIPRNNRTEAREPYEHEGFRNICEKVIGDGSTMYMRVKETSNHPHTIRSMYDLLSTGLKLTWKGDNWQFACGGRRRKLHFIMFRNINIYIYIHSWPRISSRPYWRLWVVRRMFISDE